MSRNYVKDCKRRLLKTRMSHLHPFFKTIPEQFYSLLVVPVLDKNCSQFPTVII